MRTLPTTLSVAAALALTLLAATHGCGDGDDAAPAAPANLNNGGTNDGTNNGTNDGDSNNGATNNGATNNGGQNNGTPVNNGVTNNGGPVNNGTPTNNGGPVNNGNLEGNCDPVGQDCPETQQCLPIEGVPTCVPRNPIQAGVDEPCEGGDCAVGLQCVNWGGNIGQRCARMCDRATGAGCDEGQQCSANIRQNPSIGLCQAIPASCDIYTQDCQPGEACTFGRDPMTNDPIFVCVLEGTQTDGQPCGNDNGRCAAGLVCIREDDTHSLCHQVCSTDEHCANGQTCSGRANTWDVTFCR